MWLVRNTLRGILTLRGLGVSLPPSGELDLDRILGRETAEASNQVAVALEEGYLQTVAKRDGAGGDAPDADAIGSALEARLESFKRSLREELSTLRTQLSGDVRDMLSGLKVAKLKLTEEKQRLLVDDSLSGAEIRARLAFLEEQERELTRSFDTIGRKAAKSSANVEAKADLLSSM